jgi:hypothetical protein
VTSRGDARPKGPERWSRGSDRGRVIQARSRTAVSARTRAAVWTCARGDRLVGPVGLLRQAARAEDQGGNVYLRDQVAVEARPSAMPALARLALPNMEQVLAQVGATMGEVVAMI